ncbi:hypothetical protein BGZ83_003915 [Gryganskiella cystojenkinii]|nr:hypothetical protein BGZ83_003915 [Gryganskiella cystojenkinii]
MGLQEAKAWMESVTKAIHARIRVRGGFMIDYAPLGAYLPVFFRVVLNPPTIRELDLVKLIEEILECGEAVAELFFSFIINPLLDEKEDIRSSLTDTV